MQADIHWLTDPAVFQMNRLYAAPAGVCGAMRGVGGIDSFGADVEKAYQISAAEDIAFSFRIRLI